MALSDRSLSGLDPAVLSELMQRESSPQLVSSWPPVRPPTLPRRNLIWFDRLLEIINQHLHNIVRTFRCGEAPALRHVNFEFDPRRDNIVLVLNFVTGEFHTRIFEYPYGEEATLRYVSFDAICRELYDAARRASTVHRFDQWEHDRRVQRLIEDTRRRLDDVDVYRQSAAYDREIADAFTVSTRYMGVDPSVPGSDRTTISYGYSYLDARRTAEEQRFAMYEQMLAGAWPAFPGHWMFDPEQEIRRKESEARGLELLKEWLSPAQLEQYEKHKHFDVTASTGKRYRIKHGSQQNVFELDAKDRPGAGWCFVPQGSLVPGDVMLAQKVALETDERAALSVAQPFGDHSGRPTVEIVFPSGASHWAHIDTPRSSVDPRSWMAGWGVLGTDLAAPGFRGSRYRGTRRRRRRA